jgi:hypothetical protein
VTSRASARSRARVDQCVSAVRAVEVPVLVCLRSSCSHVTEVGGPFSRFKEGKTNDYNVHARIYRLYSYERG